MLVNPNLQQRLVNLPKRMSDPKSWIHGLQKMAQKYGQTIKIAVLLCHYEIG